jgi:hypothetical protein
MTVSGPMSAQAKGEPAAIVPANCDAIVATVVVAHDRPRAIEPSVIEFLNSKTIVHWAEVTLGL